MTRAYHGNSTHGHAKGAGRGKRGSFPWINTQIVAAAETEDLHALLNTISTHLHEMNLVNVSTALHRVAKLSPCTASQPHNAWHVDTVVKALVEMGRHLLEKLKLSGSTPKCQSLSNIAWALATLRVVDLPLLQMVSASSQRQLADFKSFELCQLLWALAKLETVDPDVCDHTAVLFNMAAQFITENVRDFSFRGLVMIAWAFATAKQHDSSLFRAIASQLTPSLDSANCQELANTAWSFSTAGVHDRGLFNALASTSVPRMHGFKPQELSSILWSFASTCHIDDEFYEVAGRRALKMELQTQQLANILWALAKMRPHHLSTQEITLALLPRCTQMINIFKLQELASIALAASKCFGKCLENEESCDIVPRQVTNFFNAALPVATANLRKFSGQSLANIASSYLAVNVGELSRLFLGLSYEINGTNRAETLENSALLLLLKSLPLTPQKLQCQCGLPLHSAIARLFDEAARRTAVLPARELRIASRIAARLLEGTSHGECASRVCAMPSKNKEVLNHLCAVLASRYRSTNFLSESSRDAETAIAKSTETEEAGGQTAEAPSSVVDYWTAPIKVTFASTGRPLSNWDARATEQLRQDMEVVAFHRAERTQEPAENINGPIHVARSESPERDVVLNVSVKNTFLDLEPNSASELDDSDIVLEPALDFIPDDVSKEKLQAHRLNYRKFRTGCSIGAKGEWDAVVDSDSIEQENDDFETAEETNAAFGHWPSPIKLTVANTGRPASHFDALATEQLRCGMEMMATRRDGVTGERNSVTSSDPDKDIAVNVSVRNTFLDLEESDDSDFDDMAFSLGPSLDFVPDDVSAEKLQTHRVNYRKFRVGNGIGAKGELDAVF